MVIMEGGYTEKFDTELDIPYDGIYSKFISKVTFRGKHNMVTEWGFTIKGKYSKYSSYGIVRSLKKQYEPNEVYSLFWDNMIYNVLVNELPKSDILITENDLLGCERSAKMEKLRLKMKREKSFIFRLKKKFKK